MKTMKSYRMDDSILNMIDYIKKELNLSTDTRTIEFGIIELYWRLRNDKDT